MEGLIIFLWKYFFYIYFYLWKIDWSAKPKGNTSILINWVFDELKKEGIECEMVMLGEGLFYCRDFFFLFFCL